ncbi:MarR family winged helix-turn-helix transcriptional regulator [Massilia cavernae]|uniref:MarR family transcriptional regulator n=1 Tax=Massilia cavernae TaxID=2320864 RepID=A0A418Y5Q2_9BURK|nr:MarR family transcriptional regulator [Massilia cavernae]RJG22075.1 MarR family transcriptional regulator [Massilia cavernae]
MLNQLEGSDVKDYDDPASRQSGTARTSYLLAQCFHALRSLIEPALKSFNITPLQYTILSVALHTSKLSSAKLSRRFYITPQSMGQMLGGLEERGLVRREQDPANRRILLVSLTEEGCALAKRCAEQIERIEREAFGEFHPDDIEQFRESLRRLSNKVRNGVQMQAPP